jgi:hypothetical protein
MILFFLHAMMRTLASLVKGRTGFFAMLREKCRRDSCAKVRK